MPARQQSLGLARAPVSCRCSPAPLRLCRSHRQPCALCLPLCCPDGLPWPAAVAYVQANACFGEVPSSGTALWVSRGHSHAAASCRLRADDQVWIKTKGSTRNGMHLPDACQAIRQSGIQLWHPLPCILHQLRNTGYTSPGGSN